MPFFRFRCSGTNKAPCAASREVTVTAIAYNVAQERVHDLGWHVTILTFNELMTAISTCPMCFALLRSGAPRPPDWKPLRDWALDYPMDPDATILDADAPHAEDDDPLAWVRPR
jgi:hypothetical protein